MSDSSQISQHGTNSVNTSASVLPVSQLPLGTVLIPAVAAGAESSVSNTVNLAQTPSTGQTQHVNMNTSLVSSAPLQQAQAMGALAPFFMQPIFAQNLLQQQLQHQNNAQAVIQNLFGPSNAGNSNSAFVSTSSPVTAAIQSNHDGINNANDGSSNLNNSTNTSQISIPQMTIVAPQQGQNSQAEVLQNLMKLSATKVAAEQQQQSTPQPQLNMLQNLVGVQQHQQPPLGDGAGQSETTAGLANAVESQQEEKQAPTQQPPLQQQPRVETGTQPTQQTQTTISFKPAPTPPLSQLNTVQVVAPSIPANMLQNLLKLNSSSAAPTAAAAAAGLLFAPQNPTFFGLNNAAMMAASSVPTQPQVATAQTSNPTNQLMMQNLLSQVAAVNPVALGAGATAGLAGTIVPIAQTTQGLAAAPMISNPAAATATTTTATAMPNTQATGVTHPSTAVVAASAAVMDQRKNRLPMPIFMDYDEETLTEYQCLLRKQIELFEASPEDIKASAQGRNNPILLGQVGIRCRHCTNFPLKCRPRGAVYYSRTIDGLYQVAQNMSKLHFCKTCNQIPPQTRARLSTLQKVNRRAAGGKEYWSEGLRVLGVYEDGNVMRFRHSILGIRNTPPTGDQS